MNTLPETKIWLAQMRVFPGRPRDNTRRITGIIKDALRDGADMVVFPELAVPGYLLGDMWERDSFVRECEDCGLEILEASKKIVVIFGNIGVDRARCNEDGRIRKYNALFVAENGKFVRPDNSPYDFVLKTLMPNYREFDDSRHFHDTRKLALELGMPVSELIRPVRTRKLIMGCVLCEDAWDANYAVSPLDILSRANPDLYINISSSPFTMNKNARRVKMFSDRAAKLGKPLLYVNSVGLQNNGKTVFTFDGGTCVYGPSGKVLPGPAPFEESVLKFGLPPDKSQLHTPGAYHADDGPAEIHRAITYGTREFMKECGIRKVVVGISGGIDSALAAAVYAGILEPENLLLVNMPGRHNSATTINLARQLAANTGCFHAELPIDGSVDLTCSQIDGLEISDGAGHKARLKISSAMNENIQARDRSSRILAALASAFGGGFTCNANKSELTVGYGTLYGDICGFLANLADLWKGEVFGLARYINEQGSREIIPDGIFDLKPSAELGPEQNVDENKGDPLIYPYHDRLFASWVERWNRVTPEEILEWYIAGQLENEIGFEGKIREIFSSPRDFVEDLERWWGLYQGLAVAKRIQAPPVLALKRRAFGFDHRESQLPAWLSKKYLTLKNRLLGQN